ncbi:MAG: efflux RND transporter periplasmic adaptor subunit [Acidobacteriota bacterium]
MLKRFLIFFLIIFYFGCGQATDEKKIKEDIVKYKKKIVDLKIKVSKLEEEIKKSPSYKPDNGIFVSVSELKPDKFEHYFIVNGNVEAVKEAFISPELGGQIKKIYTREGDRVNKGTLLAELNSDIIKSSILEVENSLALAETVFKKRDGLWKKNIGSEIEYLQSKNNKESLEKKIKTLKYQLNLSRIIAPINGIVDRIDKKRGELAVPGAPLMQLVNLNTLYIKSDVSEFYLSKIKKGDNAEITFPSFPDIKINAKILRVGNVVNPQNRTFRITIEISNKKEILKPNMVAVIKLRDFIDNNSLTAPSLIIKKDTKGFYLYKVSDKKGDIEAEKVYVKTGLTSNDNTRIISGLNPGDRIIVKGYNLVKNGSKIRLKL